MSESPSEAHFRRQAIMLLEELARNGRDMQKTVLDPSDGLAMKVDRMMVRTERMEAVMTEVRTIGMGHEPRIERLEEQMSAIRAERRRIRKLAWTAITAAAASAGAWAWSKLTGAPPTSG